MRGMFAVADGPEKGARTSCPVGGTRKMCKHWAELCISLSKKLARRLQRSVGKLLRNISAKGDMSS